MAEVKVRITAQNETQTGFQAALTNAKKFGAEASRAASVSVPTPAAAASNLTSSARPETPPELQELLDQLRAARELARQPIDIAVEGGPEAAATSSRLSQSIRGLAGDLLNANSAGDVFSAVINRLTTAMGGLIAAAAGFAIGRVIAGQIDQATASMENLNSLAGRLNESLNSLNAPNVTFDQLGSSVAAVTANVNALKAANEEMQGSFRNQTIDAAFKALGMLGTLPQLPASGPLGLIGSGVNAFGLGGGFLNAANEEVDSAAAAARADVALKIKQLTADEIALSKTRTEEERKLLQLQQERAQLRITVGVAGGQKALAELEALFAAQDAAQQKQEAAQKRLQQQQAQGAAVAAAQNQAMANQVAGMTPEERLAFNKQGLQDLDGFVGPEVERERLELIGQIDALERQISERKKQDAERAAQEKERAVKSISDTLENRQFAGMSPAEQQAQIARDQATLLSDIEGGNITDAEAAQRAMELARRQDSLANGGFQGSSGASAFQRVGLATNEFFDTRKAKDPAEGIAKGNILLGQIKDALSKAEPLVLNPSSS